MKLKLHLLLAALILSLTVSAQWVQKANFAGISKAKSTAFTIGDTIYVMGGVNSSGNTLNDFWEYSIFSNTWTQRPPFPGPERYGATAFVLNNKGYVATGANDFGYLDDLWQYNPPTGAWIQKTGLPAGSAQHENQRREAYSFVIGNKAYLGGGDGFVFGPNSTNNTSFYDLWEYNPANDSWTTKAIIPDFIGRDMSIGVAINNKGYVGLGCNEQQNINRRSFWEYNPLTDSWTAKPDFPTIFTTDAGAFVLDSDLYVVGGVELGTVSLSSQFYKFDPTANTWTQLPAFNGGAVAGEFSISTATAAYVGTGYNGSLVPRNDLWKYTIAITGIHENDLLTGTYLYPNPASGNISIQSQKEISFLEVYDVTGKMVLREENNFNNINILNLIDGVYNMKLVFRDGSLTDRRFIKTN